MTFGDLRLRIDVTGRELGRDLFRPYLPARELTLRLKQTECEMCGRVTEDLEVHHIRQLKDIRQKVREGKAKRWQLVMAARKRKTLVICEVCHNQIHNS